MEIWVKPLITIDNTTLNYIIRVGLQVVENVCKIPLQKLTFLFR